MPPQPPSPAPPADDAPYVPTEGQFAVLRALLTRYGLLSLYEQAVNWLIDGTADDEDRLVQAMWETQEFRNRFQGIFQREQAGLPAISVNEYLAYEDQAFQMMRENGFPPGFYDDPDDFAKLIGNNVSINELQQRLTDYSDLAAAGREQYRTELSRHFAGQLAGDEVDVLSDAELASVIIDPTRALPALRQRLQAAQVSAAAADTGFGSLSYGEATRLTGTGMTEEAARQAFGQLAAQGDVTGALAGEDEGLSRETQLGVAAGDASALTALERARRRRQGAFEGGGGFATGNEGVAGIGRA